MMSITWNDAIRASHYECHICNPDEASTFFFDTFSNITRMLHKIASRDSKLMAATRKMIKVLQKPHKED